MVWRSRSRLVSADPVQCDERVIHVITTELCTCAGAGQPLPALEQVGMYTGVQLCKLYNKAARCREELALLKVELQQYADYCESRSMRAVSLANRIVQHTEDTLPECMVAAGMAVASEAEVRSKQSSSHDCVGLLALCRLFHLSSQCCNILIDTICHMCKLQLIVALQAPLRYILCRVDRRKLPSVLRGVVALLRAAGTFHMSLATNAKEILPGIVEGRHQLNKRQRQRQQAQQEYLLFR